MGTLSQDYMRIGHVGYTTGNLNDALDFYCGKLGIENSRVQVSDQPYLSDVTGHPECKLKIGFTSPKDAELPFEIIEYLSPAGGKLEVGMFMSGSAHISWEVDDLSIACEKLKAKGIPLVAPASRISHGIWKGAQTVYFQDPDGLINQFIEIAGREGGSGRIRGMHHVCYIVDDMDSALNFLCKDIGMEFIEKTRTYDELPIEIPPGGSVPFEAAYARFPEGDFFIELWKYGHQGKMPTVSSNMTGSIHFCINVGSIHYFMETLESAGIPIAGPPAMVTAGINKGALAKYLPPIHGIVCELFQGRPILL